MAVTEMVYSTDLFCTVDLRSKDSQSDLIELNVVRKVDVPAEKPASQVRTELSLESR